MSLELFMITYLILPKNRLIGDKVRILSWVKEKLAKNSKLLS